MTYDEKRLTREQFSRLSHVQRMQWIAELEVEVERQRRINEIKNAAWYVANERAGQAEIAEYVEDSDDR